MKLLSRFRSEPEELDQTPEHLKPAAARFDLLHGTYQRATRQRLVLLTAVGIAATLLIILAGETLRQTFAAAGVENRIERLEENIDQVTTELEELSQTGGLSEEELRSYLRDRESSVTSITGEENDLPTLLDLLRSRKPGGVIITRLALTPPDDEDEHGRVELVVSLPDYDALGGWMDTLDTIPYFAGGGDDVRWSGSPGSADLTATFETPLTIPVPTDRHATLEELFQNRPDPLASPVSPDRDGELEEWLEGGDR